MQAFGVVLWAALAGIEPSAPLPESALAAPLLGLDDAVALALQANRRIVIADALVASADAGISEARSGQAPRLDLEESFTRTTNPVFVFGNLLGQERFSQQNFELSSLNRPDALSNFHGRVSISQPLYSGGSLRHGIEAARLTHDAALFDRERTRQQVVREAVEAYTGAVLATRQLEVAREALEVARAGVRLVENQREAGLVVESDLLQAEVRQSEVEEMRIRSESDEVLAHAKLNFVLGRSLDTPYTLPSRLDEVPGVEGDLDSLLREARENRPDLHAATRWVEVAEHETGVARASGRPEIGLRGAYEANDASAPRVDDGTNWSLIVGARYTAFDGGGRAARVRRAEERRRVAESTRDLLDQQIGLEVRQAFYDIEAAGKRREQAGRAAGLAERSLRIVQDRYAEGLSTLLDLLESETAWTRSRTREVSAHRDLIVSRASLLLAVGRL